MGGGTILLENNCHLIPPSPFSQPERDVLNWSPSKHSISFYYKLALVKKLRVFNCWKLIGGRKNVIELIFSFLKWGRFRQPCLCWFHQKIRRCIRSLNQAQYISIKQCLHRSKTDLFQIKLQWGREWGMCAHCVHKGRLIKSAGSNIFTIASAAIFILIIIIAD